MNANNPQNGWESLRHFGLLLAPNEGTRLEAERAPEPLLWHRIDPLRRELIRRDAGEVEVGAFVAWVLEQICGFTEPQTGHWQRGREVSAAFTQTLVTGEGLKPRHVWTGIHGGMLPVFFDNARVLGLGRGRKAVSDCVQWLRRARQPLALLTNGRQWRLLYAGLDFEAACEWDTELWFAEGQPGPQLEALRWLLQPALFDPPETDGEPALLAAIQASRRGQSELSAILGERVREAVEALVRAHGESLSRQAYGATGADIYRAAVRVVMRMVVILFAESRDLLPRAHPVYHDAYGLQGLFEALQRVAVRGRGRLSHRFGAWPRVLALFRLICDGSYHEGLEAPTYGGDLFAPGDPEANDPVVRALSVFETACFDSSLELMPDAVVYRMLELLTRTQVRVRQGRSTTLTVAPIDFSDLSSEYIGILYEGLLDYELRTAPADDSIVFLAVGDEPALPLSRLEGMEERQIKDLFEKLQDTSGGEEETGEEGAEEGEAEAGEEAEGEGEGKGEDEGEGEGEGEEEAVVPEEEESAGEEGEVSPVEAARQRALAWTRDACLAAGLVPRPRGRLTPEKQRAFERRLEGKARQLVRRVDPAWRVVPGALGGHAQGRGHLLHPSSTGGPHGPPHAAATGLRPAVGQGGSTRPGRAVRAVDSQAARADPGPQDLRPGLRFRLLPGGSSALSIRRTLCLAARARPAGGRLAPAPGRTPGTGRQR